MFVEYLLFISHKLWQVSRSELEGRCPSCGGLGDAKVLMMDGTAVAPPKEVRASDSTTSTTNDSEEGIRQGVLFQNRVMIPSKSIRSQLLRFADKVPPKSGKAKQKKSHASKKKRYRRRRPKDAERPEQELSARPAPFTREVY